jgi:hypothetical protein
MTVTRGVTGVLLVVVAALLVLPQLFTEHPAQILVVAGVLIGITGGVLMCDDLEGG